MNRPTVSGSRTVRYATALALTAMLGVAVLTQQRAGQQPAGQPGQRADTGEIKVQRIRSNVYMLVGDGANITLQVDPPAGIDEHDSVYGGDRGVVLIDTGTAELSDKLTATIRQFSPRGAIHYIINTSADPDHVGGNERLVKAQGTVIRGAQGGAGGGSPLMVIAHEHVLTRMSAPSGQQALYPVDAWPTDTFLTDKEVFFNSESVKIINQPGAHSDGDSLVYFRRSDVISAGEIFSTTTFPIFDPAKGGHIQGVLDGVNKILDLAIPGEKEEGGTMIVPGHGRLCDEADVEYYRELLSIVRDRIQDGIKNGMTLQQVKAAKPTLEYDKRYSKPNWTSDQFVEAVYKDLSQSAKPAAVTPSRTRDKR